MRTILFLSAILAFSVSTTSNVSAQATISYFYDDAGNRIERTIVFNTLHEKSAKVDSLKQKEVLKDKMGESTILIYPNPTRGQLLVEISGYDETAKTGLYLYNLSGNLLISKSPVTGSDPLDLTPYPIGTYVLKIMLGDKITEWKIIKQ